MSHKRRRSAFVFSLAIMVASGVIGGGGPAVAQPPPGRTQIRFQVQTDEHGDLNVIPSDAMGLLASGRLDRRLFNVTDLVENGFDDTARKSIR